MQEIMRDPFILVESGISYHRGHIEHWIKVHGCVRSAALDVCMSGLGGQRLPFCCQSKILYIATVTSIFSVFPVLCLHFTNSSPSGAPQHRPRHRPAAPRPPPPPQPVPRRPRRRLLPAAGVVDPAGRDSRPDARFLLIIINRLIVINRSL